MNSSPVMKPHSLLEHIGLLQYYPKKLSIRDAIQVREDTLNTIGTTKDSILYPFVILQKIMAFDSKCRIPFNKCSFTVGKLDGSSDSESDESENSDLVHPMDGLLALIHCCDNFLRQDLFSRMATCQIAVPLLLPDPHTGELTIPLWAMRSIVKEFEMDKHSFCGRITDIPMHHVSFLRVGCHGISKSEIMNGVMTMTESDNRNEPFFGCNSPGGESEKVLVNGLVEISWYLPGDQLFPMPIAFINFRGDATDPNYEKQLDFLCKFSAINVILFSSDILEDITREGAIALLKKLSTAKGMTILLQTKKETKEFKKTIFVALGESNFESKFKILKHENNRPILVKKLQYMLSSCLSNNSRKFPLSHIVCESSVACDENDLKCRKGKELMEELFSVVKRYISSSKHIPGGMLQDKSPKDLLPLQSEGLWHAWAAHDKEQYRQKYRHKHGKMMLHCSGQKSVQDLSAREYGEKLRSDMSKLRKKQLSEFTKQNLKEKSVANLFLCAIRTDDKVVLWYFMNWLKIALDDLSRDIRLPLYTDLWKLRAKLIETKRTGRYEPGEEYYVKQLQDLNKRMINASFGVEHLMREVGQIYEAVAEYEDASQPECCVKDLPQIAAQMLCDGFPLELLDGDAEYIPRKWISAVLHSLARLLKGDSESDPRIYVLSVLGIRSTGKSTLLNTMFGVQLSVSAGRCTCGALMQLIPVHPSLHRKTGVQYFLLIDTEGLRAPELDRLAAFEHDNELATFVIGVANQTLINVYGEVAGEIDDILNVAVHAFMRMNEVHLNPSCHFIHQNLPAVIAKDKLLQGRLKTNNKLDKMTKAAAKDTDQENKYKLFSDVIRFDYKGDVSEFVAPWSGELPMAQVSSDYSKRAQQLKVEIINKCGKSRSKNTVPLLLMHLDKLWNAILQEDFVFTFQNTYEIVAYKALEVKFSDCTGRYMTDIMNELQQAAENELYSCNVIDLDEMLEKHTKLLEKCAWKCFKKCEEQMIDFIKEDDIMLKWKQDMELRLKHLYEEKMANVKENSKQAYHAKKDRNEAESEREALGIMIQGKVVELTKEIEEKKYSEEELIRIFNQTWSEWIESMNVKPFKMPNIENAVEKCITDSFPGKWKDIRANVDKGLQKCTEFEVTINHIKSKTTTFAKLLAWVSQNPQINPLQKAQSYTDETFDEVDVYLKGIGVSDRNFSSLCVTQLLQIVKRRRSIKFQDFEFTEAYEVDVAITACSKAMPVFQEMAEKFRMKHDPLVFIQNELKPNFRRMFIQMAKKVEYEKPAAKAF